MNICCVTEFTDNHLTNADFHHSRPDVALSGETTAQMIKTGEICTKRQSATGAIKIRSARWFFELDGSTWGGIAWEA